MSTFTKRTLSFDLSSGEKALGHISEEEANLFVGGRGLGAYYLYRTLKPGVDPLSPANPLIFTAGILGGSIAPGFSRWMVITKSPLTETYMRSVCGGKFGAAIKMNRFEFVTIKGKAFRPVYLLIDGEDVKVMDAADLWGLDTEETQRKLKGIHGEKAQIACIGPAGEKVVLFSAIVHEERTAARGGVGAVMGSKNLKAVVLLGDNQPLVPAVKEAFLETVKKHNAILRDHARRKKLTRFGTTFMTTGMEKRGIFPVKNFQEGSLPGVENISGEALEAFKVGNYGCYGCTTRCGNVVKIGEGEFAGVTWEGPEYETVYAFGGEIYNTDPHMILNANLLCDRLGLDTISTGATIGFAMELFEKGILSRGDVDGLDLTWGNTASILRLIRKIAAKEGIGEILALGTRKAAEKIGKGSFHYAMNAKGLELPGYEPRAAKAHGLGYAVSNIGGSHMYGYCRQEISGRPEPIDPLTDEGKGGIIALNQVKKAKEEFLILCNFADTNVDDTLITDLLVAGTGNRDLADLDYLYTVAERIVCLERCFNAREGLTREDDYLPDRFLNEPLKNAGPATGEFYRKYDILLDEYYEALGYDGEGIPKDETLFKLSLETITSDLEQG
jgi:aldehyde:ferredoxin oxidoreductase